MPPPTKAINLNLFKFFLRKFSFGCFKKQSDIKSKWTEFENALKNAGEVSFWWRDDDIRAQKDTFKWKYIKYKFKTLYMMRLLAKYKISAIWAIVPKNYKNYGKIFTENIFKYNHYAVVHGILHQNNATPPACSEFPETCDIEKSFEMIMQYYNYFKTIFKNRLLPVFVPPYNNMCQAIKDKLINENIIISESNFYKEEHSSYNIDYDFVNWQMFKLKKENVILDELIQLLNSETKLIGLNAHHTILKYKNFRFYDKLFKTISKCKNANWIIPFDTI